MNPHPQNIDALIEEAQKKFEHEWFNKVSGVSESVQVQFFDDYLSSFARSLIQKAFEEYIATIKSVENDEAVGNRFWDGAARMKRRLFSAVEEKQKKFMNEDV